MRLLYSEEEFDGAISVAALGMFDGVHVGHQALIREAVALARTLGAEAVVCTFDRHPLSVLCPERAPEPLLPLEENLRKFARLGADAALVRPFTQTFAAMPPEEYVALLAHTLRARAIVVGENYTFGRGGRGDAALVRALADSYGYVARIVPPVVDGEGVVSSTRIRGMLRRGEIARARSLLEIPEEG